MGPFSEKWYQRRVWFRAAEAWAKFKTPNVCLRKTRHNWQRFRFCSSERGKGPKNKGQRSGICKHTKWIRTAAPACGETGLFLCVLVGFIPRMYPIMHQCCGGLIGKYSRRPQKENGKRHALKYMRKRPDSVLIVWAIQGKQVCPLSQFVCFFSWDIDFGGVA